MNHTPSDIDKGNYQKLYKLLVDQMILVLASDLLSWFPVKESEVQVTNKIGHTFTQYQDPSEKITDKLTESLRKILRDLGFSDDSKIKKCWAAIEPGSGQIIVNLDVDIKQDIARKVQNMAKSAIGSLQINQRHLG